MTDPAVADGSSWRDQAVARSLDPARVRAEKRVQGFLDAALDVMTRSPDKEFTVQEVVERSGQSLRSFYQYFTGKHELLLALFEEAVRTSAEQLERKVDGVDDPIERLHLFTSEYYRMCRPVRAKGSKAANTVSVMAEFAQQLLTKHPREAAQAFAPLAGRCEALLDEAAAVGAIHAGLDHRRITGVVLQAVMFSAFADTISASTVQPAEEEAEGLWELLLHGLSPT